MKRPVAVVLLLVLSMAIPAADATEPGTNGTIVFVRDTEQQKPQLWTLTPNGTRARLGVIGQQPEWSPDGSWILAQAWCCNSGLFKIRTDGSEKVMLTDNALTTAPSAAWSPDGSKVVFATSSYDLFVMDADGTNLLQVTEGAFCDAHPAWSPDGTRIAFMRAVQGGGAYGAGCNRSGADIWTMEPDGSSAEPLTTTTDYWETQPDWSPDSSALIAQCWYPPRYQAPNTKARLCTIDTTSGEITDFLTYRGFPSDPVWSPDGRKIAFAMEPATEENNDSEIFVMDADGAHLRQKTNNHADDLSPDWQTR